MRDVLSMEHYSKEEECDICGVIFPDSRRLYRHLFNDHGLSKEKIEEVKQARRFKQVAKKIHTSGRNRPVFECEVCQRPYLSKLGLRNHKEKEHNEIRIVVGSPDNVVCPVQSCKIRLPTYFDLATHADEFHRNLVNEMEAFRIHRVFFNTFSEFKLWKELKEESTVTRFYTRSTETKIRYAKKVWLMKCVHTHRKKNLFTSDHCPAFIRVCERYNGSIEAVACFGHLGHAHITGTDSDSSLNSRKIDYGLMTNHFVDESSTLGSRNTDDYGVLEDISVI
ncbi:unnamed protein product [Auanema sp. JU1783]|nr:unnamed protein product [Auanema sp. JU1783]